MFPRECTAQAWDHPCKGWDELCRMWGYPCVKPVSAGLLCYGTCCFFSRQESELETQIIFYISF